MLPNNTTLGQLQKSGRKLQFCCGNCGHKVYKPIEKIFAGKIPQEELVSSLITAIKPRSKCKKCNGKQVTITIAPQQKEAA